MSTSARRGVFSMMSASSVSSEAAISFSAEFFAPLIGISPKSGRPPIIASLSIQSLSFRLSRLATAEVQAKRSAKARLLRLLAGLRPRSSTWRRLGRRGGPRFFRGAFRVVSRRSGARPTRVGVSHGAGPYGRSNAGQAKGLGLRQRASFQRLFIPDMAGYIAASRPLVMTKTRPAGCGSSVVEHPLGKGEAESSILSRSTSLFFPRHETVSETSSRRCSPRLLSLARNRRDSGSAPVPLSAAPQSPPPRQLRRLSE